MNLFTFDFDMESKNLKDLLLEVDKTDKIEENKMDIESDNEKELKRKKKYKNIKRISLKY